MNGIYVASIRIKNQNSVEYTLVGVTGLDGTPGSDNRRRRLGYSLSVFCRSLLLINNTAHPSLPREVVSETNSLAPPISSAS